MQDEKIVQLYWDRDEQAIRETADKYGTYCEAVAWNILRDREDSQECVNDTWLRTWNAIPPQRPRKLRMFLAKITRNLAFDKYKANNAVKRGGEMERVLYELAECTAGGTSLEDTAIASELADAVNRFVRALPERERNVFARRYFFAETMVEIGQRYGLSGKNVTVILTRTRKKLREYLKKGGYLP